MSLIFYRFFGVCLSIMSGILILRRLTLIEDHIACEFYGFSREKFTEFYGKKIYLSFIGSSN